MKIKPILISTISLLTVIIILNFGCSHQFLTVHNYDGKQIVVIFLDKDSAFSYINNSKFAERMNRLNISLRLDEDINEVDRNNEISLYKKFIYEKLKNWDGYERNIVWGAIEDGIEKLNTFSRAIIPDTLYLINTSLRLEFNTFFTINKAICVPSSVVWPIFFKGLIKRKISHELFHIYSRYHTVQRDSLYALFNFHVADTINAGEYLQSKMINNPDVHSNNYVLHLKDSSGVSKNLFLVARLNEKKYNDNRGIISFLGTTNIFGYFDKNIYELEQTGTNSYQVKDKEKPVNLNWDNFRSDFDSTCGCLSEDRYFAEEILADAFVLSIMSDEDHELPDNCSLQDKKKLERLLEIIRGKK